MRVYGGLGGLRAVGGLRADISKVISDFIHSLLIIVAPLITIITSAIIG